MLVPKITNRVRYTFDLIFHELLGLSVKYTSDQQEYISFNEAKIIYGNTVLDNQLHFPAHELLFEEGIKKINYNDLQDDVFARVFYMLSRYEEYNHPPLDKLGRFSAKFSDNPELTIPLVNQWATELKEILSNSFPNLELELPIFQFNPTYDIDIAFKYLGRGIFRSIGGYLRDLFKGAKGETKNRRKTLLGTMEDPYNVFDWLNKLHEKLNVSPTFFFPVGEYGKHDKHIDIEDPSLLQIIHEQLHDQHLGLHPTYKSNFEHSMPEEKKRLENILGHSVHKSRQHYLLLHFPKTYHQLIEAGIREDYSMGFHDKAGFRAGICSPFFWFDLEKNEQTELRVFPFTIMEASYQYYNHPDNVLDQMKALVDQVKKYNGTLITIWHNNSLSEEFHEGKWRKMYLELLDYIHS